MTTVAPQRPLAPRPAGRSQSRPVPVSSLPAELLDVDLDVVHPVDDPAPGPSADVLLTCSAILGGIVAFALLAGEFVTHLF